MKNWTKALLLALCAIALVVASVMGTVAYLTAKDEVVNTFTVGDVKIVLDEAQVNEYGEKVDDTTRVKANTYKLLPGHTYVKDPTVTVEDGSEQAYVRMLVTVNDITKLTTAITKEAHTEFYATVEGEEIFLLEKLVTGWDATAWTSESVTKNGNEVTYEFRYYDVVDARNGEQKLDALFDEIVIPNDLTNAEIAALNEAQINVVAEAIQADGFTDADAAWTAFGSQR